MMMRGITAAEMERQHIYCVDKLNALLYKKKYDEAIGYARCLRDFGLYEDDEHLDMFINKVNELKESDK